MATFTGDHNFLHVVSVVENPFIIQSLFKEIVFNRYVISWGRKKNLFII